MYRESIVDASKPNAGRMYDYYLGGSHNFEIDRQAAEQVLKNMPFISKYVRMQRWALQDIAAELSEVRGYDVIIDFASGLPTSDNIHSKVPEGTTVIYSDYDPVVVEYAHEILGDNPNVYFFESDACHPEELLESPKVQQILMGRRKVAFVLWGVSVFLPDDGIAHATRYIHDWAAPGSCLAFNAQGANAHSTPAGERVKKVYEQMGSKLYLRSLDQYSELLQPWKLDGDGFVSLLSWHGFEQSELGKEDAAAFGPMGGGYGAYLIK
jgi:hypothetical protein